MQSFAILGDPDIAIVVLTEDLNFTSKAQALNPCRLEADWSNRTAVNESYFLRTIGLGKLKSKPGEQSWGDMIWEGLTADDGTFAEDLMVCSVFGSFALVGLKVTIIITKKI